MNQKEIEEVKQKILEYRKNEGYPLSEISKRLEETYSWIYKIDEELQEEGALTKEEIKRAQEERRVREFKENPIVIEVLELKRKGMSDEKIAKESNVNRTQQQISNYVRRAIELKMISKEEIGRVKGEKNQDDRKKKIKDLENNPLIMEIFELKKQGFLDREVAEHTNMSESAIYSYVKKGIEQGILKKEEIEKAKMERKNLKKKESTKRKRVLEGLRRGETYAKIVDDTNISNTQVSIICKELIREGMITQEEIEEAKKNAKMEKRQKRENERDREEDKEKLLSYLILGYKGRIIKSKLGNLSDEEYQQIVNELIKEKRITKKEILEYREKREEQEKETVLEELKKGKKQIEIAEIIKKTEKETKRMIEKIKKEKNISDEDILRWKNENENSVEKKKSIVLEGLKKGLSRKEIIENAKQKSTIQNIGNYVTLLVKEGAITREEIKENRQKRREENRKKNKEKLNQFEKEMLNYLTGGYEMEEILSLSSKSKPYIYAIIAGLKKKGKITEEEIEQARIRRKEEKEKVELKKAIREMEQQSNRLKREIDSEIRFGKKPSQEKLEKMREYINLCQERYQKEKITRPELLYLGQVIQKVESKERDVLQFVKLAISIGEYQEGLNFVRFVQEEQTRNFSENGRQKVEKLEEVLSKANKVQQALQTIKRGNTNTAVLSNVTGLSKDEINMLKIRTTGKSIRIAGPIKRRNILDALAMDKDPEKIQKEIGISDFEMDDMIEQRLEYKQQKKKYKKATSEQEKQEIQEQIEKDIRTRVIVLYTKLGKNPEFIAKVLKKKPEEIQEDLDYAIEKGMIKEEQLQGIDPLVSCNKALREQITL